MTTMLHPLSSAAAPPLHGSGDPIAPPRSSTPAVSAAPQSTALFVNPSFQFDPTVGLVVIQFRDDKGAISDTIPSQRQLAAYRDHQAALPGEGSPLAGDGKITSG
jgi:hypothetical protein